MEQMDYMWEGLWWMRTRWARPTSCSRLTTDGEIEARCEGAGGSETGGRFVQGMRGRCRRNKSSTEANLGCSIGQRSEDPPHILQGQDLQEAHTTQSHTVQGRKGETENPTLVYSNPGRLPTASRILGLTSSPGIVIRPGKAPIRSQAVRLRWSDEARVPQEGEDNQEGRVETGVHSMQNEGTAKSEAMQAFRAGR